MGRARSLSNKSLIHHKGAEGGRHHLAVTWGGCVDPQPAPPPHRCHPLEMEGAKQKVTEPFSWESKLSWAPRFVSPNHWKHPASQSDSDVFVKLPLQMCFKLLWLKKFKNAGTFHPTGSCIPQHYICKQTKMIHFLLLIWEILASLS